jgi:stearoyl-CoA 9-desaturase NADPH oxidoreductase
MPSLDTSAPRGAKGASFHLRGVRDALRSGVARRMFLDRTVDFWLGQASRTWSLEELRARVVAVIEETHDVRTFVLRPGAGWQGHRAGQYVPVDIEIDGVRVRRCYSIASAPGSRDIAITVKRVPGGRVSGWMHDHLHAGDVVGLGVAAGDFTLPVAAPEKLLFLSGGSGVTPVMSMLRDLAARREIHDVVFVHCARTRADVIFHDELSALAAAHPGLRLVLRLDDEAPGPLDASAARALVPDVAERTTYLCGPAGMMSAVQATWSSLGIEGALHLERFVAPRPTVSAGASGNRIHLAMAGRTVEAGAPGTLLEQLERAGERPAHGCRMGICNTCRCRKRSGTVIDAVTGEISSEPDEEIRLCVSLARSDVDLAL